MSYLFNVLTGAITDSLPDQSVEYQTLIKMRVQAEAAGAAFPKAVEGQVGSSRTIKKGEPLWEEISEQDAGFPDPAGGRVLVVACGGAAAGADETTDINELSVVGGKLTAVQYVPSAAITGVTTNSRKITLQQTQVTGTSSPARAVTALAEVEFKEGINNEGNNTPTALTIVHAEFSAADPERLEVVSAHVGTGLADPGGILIATYTRV